MTKCKDATHVNVSRVENVNCDLANPEDVGKVLARFAQAMIDSKDEGGIVTGLFLKNEATGLVAALADLKRQGYDSPRDWVYAAVNAYAQTLAFFITGLAQANKATKDEITSVALRIANDFSSVFMKMACENSGIDFDEVVDSLVAAEHDSSRVPNVKKNLH